MGLFNKLCFENWMSIWKNEIGTLPIINFGSKDGRGRVIIWKGQGDVSGVLTMFCYLEIMTWSLTL